MSTKKNEKAEPKQKGVDKPEKDAKKKAAKKPEKDAKKKAAKKPEKDAKKKAVVAKSPQVEVLGPDPFATTATKLDKLTEAEAPEVARELVQTVEVSYFKLGGVLAKINENVWFEGLGFDNFKAYVESELDFQHRKAMYLITIYEHIVDANIPYEKIKGLSWGKLKELAPILDSKNVASWVKKAMDMTVLQLSEEVKEVLRTGEGSSGNGKQVSKETVTMTFKVHPDQKLVITEAIELAKDKTGTEFSNSALESICMQYMSAPIKKKGDDKSNGAGKITKGQVVELVRGMGVKKGVSFFEKIFSEEGLILTAETAP